MARPIAGTMQRASYSFTQNTFFKSFAFYNMWVCVIFVVLRSQVALLQKLNLHSYYNLSISCTYVFDILINEHPGLY